MRVRGVVRFALTLEAAREIYRGADLRVYTRDEVGQHVARWDYLGLNPVLTDEGGDVLAVELDVDA